MKRIFPLLSLLALILCNSYLISQNHLDQSMKMVDSYFDRLEDYGLSGSLLIGNKKGILLNKNYGQKTSQETTDLAYSVGSLTKQFTATAILLLEQRGKLKTGNHASEYLDYIPSDKSEITIHHLLTHTSGLGNPYWDQNPDLTEIQYLKKVLSESLDNEPGTRFNYSNFGYHLLAKIVEAVSNKSYEHFLSDDLFKPNGLQRTGFNLVDWDENQVVEYRDWTVERSSMKLSNPLDRPIYLQPEGSGAILSTTDDMYKWYQHLFNSDEILTEESKKKLLTVEMNNYGYAWNIYKTRRGTKLIEHGAYDSWLGVVAGFYNYIDEDLVIIFLGNTHMSGILRKEDLVRNIEAIIFGGTIMIPPVAGSNPHIKHDYKGEYTLNNVSIEISEGNLPNQLRLRTENPEVIRKILLPGIETMDQGSDEQIISFFEKINQNDWESVKGMVYDETPFEYLKPMYAKVWNDLTTGYGTYKGIKTLHFVPGEFGGKFELQVIAEGKFERGNFPVRVFRNHKGKLHVQPLQYPSQLEIFLSPSMDNQFTFWNIKFGMITKFKFDGNQLIINSDEGMKFNKT